MYNRKGFSLLGMLIAVTVVMVLTIMLLKQYQAVQTAQQARMRQALRPLQTTGQTDAQNAARQLRSSVQDIEKAAARRAEQQENMYK